MVYGLATLLLVPSHSTASETKSDFKAHLLPEPLALERCPTSAHSGNRKGKPSSVTSEILTHQSQICDPLP